MEDTLKKRGRGAPRREDDDIRFKLSGPQFVFVSMLMRRGSYGDTPLSVVKQLLNQQFQLLQQSGELPKEAPFAIQSIPSAPSSLESKETQAQESHIKTGGNTP